MQLMFNTEDFHLKSTSFYESLNDDEKKYVKAKITRLEFKKDQLLFREGSHAKGVYLVRKGKIKIFKTSEQGGQSIVHIYRKGDYFGYRPLLAGNPQPVSAAAMDQVVVSFIPSDSFMLLFNTSKTLAKNIALTLASEFSVWINKMTVFTQYSVKERIALSLLILARVYQRGNEPNVIISISRSDLAGFVGTAKESLVRNLRFFKDDKIIATRGTKIQILDMEALHRYS